MQVTAVPTQRPDWHWSANVQLLLSSQGVLSVFTGLEQTPLVGSHVPARWHSSTEVHVTGTPVTQTPDWHESDRVHLSPSSHGVLSAFAGFEHTPMAGSHVPAS